MDDTTLYAGRFLHLLRRTWTDRDGQQRAWEFSRRTGPGGACYMIAYTPGDPPGVLLVEQFRPPVGTTTIEFPAGLVDPGEDIATTALRELAEETGWQGEVIAMGPRTVSSAGMTDEWIVAVEIRLTQQGSPAPHDGEAITVHTVPLDALTDRLRAWADAGHAIDAKLWAWAQGRAG